MFNLINLTAIQVVVLFAVCYANLCLLISVVHKAQLERFTMQNLEQISELLFPENTELEETTSHPFDDEIRNQVKQMRKERLQQLNPDTGEEIEVEAIYEEIADFIRNHVIDVGKEQAVKDFQCGLNFLHVNLKDFIKEDGDFGEKTLEAFCEICKFYGLDVIKEAIKKGALSNAVIDTASDPEVNTDFLVYKIQDNLKEMEV